MLLHSQDKVTRQQVAFTTCSLNETELRYTQIEKEILAFVYTYEKFSEYILSKTILLETDYKSLVPLLGSKSSDILQPLVPHFSHTVCLMRFQYSFNHIPGKTMCGRYVSRAPLNILRANETAKETENFVQAKISSIPNK